jgi:hypothetical protein
MHAVHIAGLLDPICARGLPLSGLLMAPVLADEALL